MFTEKLFVSLSPFSRFCRPQRRFLLILTGPSTRAGNSALLSEAQTKGHFGKARQGVAAPSEGDDGLGGLFFFFFFFLAFLFCFLNHSLLFAFLWHLSSSDLSHCYK